MRRKTPVEMERAKIVKITRSLTRLKHSLAADEEINELVPDRVAEFERALANGQLLTLELPEVTQNADS